eukprot:CAMPEP_0206561336 /NCGR_PEP_ID=MMETSP0325_2-20121206/21549_1 /ASSEMBLY_ACC=CAM_ASM_000347 /TAXON_ID=2866 /ORGANISM="Crypthecodinium cohnii, Strain Seligo" /LENGTH=33 /DNA_ID= /DNA_START= /DNA_END= /DNA_ORIENTATION=
MLKRLKGELQEAVDAVFFFRVSNFDDDGDDDDD